MYKQPKPNNAIVHEIIFHPWNITELNFERLLLRQVKQSYPYMWNTIMSDTFRLLKGQLFQVIICATDGLVLNLLSIDTHPKPVKAAKSKMEQPKSIDSKLVLIKIFYIGAQRRVVVEICNH